MLLEGCCSYLGRRGATPSEIEADTDRRSHDPLQFPGVAPRRVKKNIANQCTQYKNIAGVHVLRFHSGNKKNPYRVAWKNWDLLIWCFSIQKLTCVDKSTRTKRKTLMFSFAARSFANDVVRNKIGNVMLHIIKHKHKT